MTDVTGAGATANDAQVATNSGGGKDRVALARDEVARMQRKVEKFEAHAQQARDALAAAEAALTALGG